MSTIFANKIKNNAGGNNVKVNQLSGIDTAGSITVQGEGTATINLQQGLAKSWWRYDISGNSFDNSVNIASSTDDGTGLYSVTMTNNFSSQASMAGVSGGFTSSGGLRETAYTNYSTSSVTCTIAYQNGGGIDADNSCCHINGDLA